jgi:hypothetical protein
VRLLITTKVAARAPAGGVLVNSSYELGPDSDSESLMSAFACFVAVLAAALALAWGAHP